MSWPIWFGQSIVRLSNKQILHSNATKWQKVWQEADREEKNELSVPNKTVYTKQKKSRCTDRRENYEQKQTQKRKLFTKRETKNQKKLYEKRDESETDSGRKMKKKKLNTTVTQYAGHIQRSTKPTHSWVIHAHQINDRQHMKNAAHLSLSSQFRCVVDAIQLFEMCRETFHMKIKIDERDKKNKTLNIVADFLIPVLFAIVFICEDEFLVSFQTREKKICFSIEKWIKFI